MEPTKEFVEEQKKKYGKVFRVVIDGDVYVYRTLTRPEYKNLQKQLKPEMGENGPVLTSEQSNELEESVSKLCVLWPEDYNNENISAGVPSILATYISDVSGYKIDSVPEQL